MSWPPEVPVQFNSMGDPMLPGQMIGTGAWMPPMEATVTGDIALPGGPGDVPYGSYNQMGDIGPMQPVSSPDPMAEAARAHAGLATRGVVPPAPYESGVMSRVRSYQSTQARSRRPVPSPSLPDVRPKPVPEQQAVVPERPVQRVSEETLRGWSGKRIAAVVLAAGALVVWARAGMQDDVPRGTDDQEIVDYGP